MKNVFTNLPMEFHIPKMYDTIVVADFFVDDVQGGAELTTESLIKEAPKTRKIFKLHSNSLTPKLIQENKDKTFIITNFVTATSEGLNELVEQNINYYVIEFDYKYCRFRSEGLHLMQTKKPCDCSTNQSIKEIIVPLFQNAKKIFWMSEAQKKHYGTKIPEIKDLPSEVLSSVFDKETLDYIESVYRETKDIQKRTEIAILSKDNVSWIKGIESTIAYLNVEGKDFIHLPKLPYKEFLAEMAKYQTFCFRPSDKDTCPRIVIEAKLLGLDLLLNRNVQHKDEVWFNGSREDIVKYLSSRPEVFWNSIS
jgi:hypothetical protein